MPVVAEQPKSVEEFIKILEDKLQQGLLPCVDASGACKYREGEKACIIGLCVTDEQINSCNIFLFNNTIRYECSRDNRGELEKQLPSWLSIEKAIHLQELHDEKLADYELDPSEFLQQVKDILQND